jgi:hypothetical protein
MLRRTKYGMRDRIVRVEGLREEVVGASLHRCDSRIDIGERRHQNHFDGDRTRLDAPEELEPANTGHHHVHERHVWRGSLDVGQSVFAVFRYTDLHPACLEDTRQASAKGRLVIDD